MALPQVTLSRAENWAKKNDLKYKIDDDGDLAIGFEEVVFFIHNVDSLLRVQGYWTGPVESFSKETLLAAANEMNYTAVIPKAQVIMDRPLVVFEHAVSAQKGMTDEQLENFLDSTFMATFKAVEEFTKLVSNGTPKEGN